MRAPTQTARRITTLGALSVLLALGLAAGPRVCTAARTGLVAPPLSPPARPADCADINPGDDLQQRLDAAQDGASLCLTPGSWRGPVVLAHSVTLWGPSSAVIRTSGEGTTVRITARGARLIGVTVRGSGGRYDTEDAGVSIEADDVTVEGVRIDRAIYGILAQRVQRATLRGNTVIGTGEPALGLRGDGIRLWEATGCVVEGNTVLHSRDLVVWYAPGNRVVGNRVEHGRYGTHLMFSNGCVVERNRYVDDVVGLFVMYSHDVTVTGNVMAEATGAAGMGLGLKDSGGVTVRDNTFARVTTGAYLDTSPTRLDERNTFERNEFRLARAAVVFHASQAGNVFLANRFRDNGAQVLVEGGGDALGTRWEGNQFDDYQGYDLDGDGVGDVPYEVRSLSGDLTSRRPALAFFSATPVLALVDAASHIAPLFAPQTILVDRRPRVAVRAEAR